MSNISKKKLRLFIILFAIIALITTAVFIILKKNNQTQLSNYDNELLRTMSYEQFVDGDEAIDNTDNVKFSSFFLRDLDGDGYAEKIKGTCKEVGAEDTLYMEIIVQTAGYLKDAKIDINGQNFYLQTALPKDNELKENYIGNNIKKIEFEQLNNGTQKLLTGIVKSGDYSKYDAIGNNVNNYSRNDNSIVLTGTYVAENGTETPITKEINLVTDWYGTTEAKIVSSSTTQSRYDLPDRIDEEDGTLTLSFNIDTEEMKKELNLSSNYVEATIPQLNGYNPISVSLVSGGGETTYDETTRLFTITKNAETDANGIITTSISRNSANKIEVIYPLEAYTSLENDSVSIKIPVSTYYEGYNNQNQEFQNPYKSNIAKTTIVANYSRPKGNVANLFIEVGKYVSTPNYHYMVSKRKPLRLYNEISNEEKDDLYTVCWEAFTGSSGESNGLILKETRNGENQKTDTFIKNDSSEDSMENITTNVGIYFSNADSILENDGEIRVYNEDTGEIVHSFTSIDWNKYTSNNPYKYENSIKHIKIETTATNANSSLYVYNIKELDDDQIIETYTRDEFDGLQYIKSNLTMYLDGQNIGSKSHQANYEAPYSIANILLSKNVFSTQTTEKGLNIEIDAFADEKNNQEKWKNGTFLIKIPDEILDIKINEAIVNSLFVNLDSSEVIENNEGKFIKIKTSNVNPAAYKISINVDITPDPRIATVTKNFELYATNEESEEYYYSSSDTYDVDEDGNKLEKIYYKTISFNLVAPNSMLTNQTMSDFDNIGTIIVSPKIANLKPVYGNDDLEKQTVKVGAQLKNNYSSTISEVIMVGKIPFEGNTYVLSGGDLNSEFSTTMTSSGLTIPTELQGEVTVYYSENENPSKDILDNSNGWKLKEDVTDWTKIKTWAVDFGDTVLNKGDEYTFYYNVEIPFGVELNRECFSHHGIYFSLDTPEGKYRTQTEPTRVGIRIADKYDLELTKYQKNVNKVIEGATYRVSKLDDQGNILETQTAKTNELGQLRMTNLYAENVYEIKEIQTPKDYELNNDVIKIKGHVNRETGVLSIEKIEGTTKGEIQVIKNTGEDYKAQISVEDEARAKLKLVKYEQGTDNLVVGAKYTITGSGLPDTGKTLRTNNNGEAYLSGIKIGYEYTLKEATSPEGYYLNTDTIKFTINNNNGTYELNVISGSTKATSITQENDLPVASIEVEDEKIPTYDLTINKIEKGTGTQEIAAVPVVGAKFKLYKDNKEKGTYTTDGEGHISINGLYLYEESKDIDQTYTLKETFAPAGYAKVKDISFKAQIIDSTLTLITNDNLSYTVENNTINLKVEDSKSFKLIKKDGETNALLPNVKFAIYNEDEGETPARNSKGEIIGNKETINGKEYYTLTTNSRGEITADLSEGIYRAVEIEAADKYDIEGQEQYFGIGESREGKHIYTPDFATSFGETGYEYLESIAETEDGGYIVGGRFGSSNMQLGDYTLSSNGRSDIFLVKYDSNNEVEWASSFGGTSDDTLNSIALTEDGGYIVGGWFESLSMRVGDYTLTRNGAYDAFLVKYDRNNEVEWASSFGGTNDEYIESIAGTEDGGYIVGGYFYSSSMQVGDYTLTNKGNNDAFIVKYNRNNEVEWASSFGETSNEYLESIAVTEDGGYIVGGFFQSPTMQIGDYTLTNKGVTDAYLVKYDRNNEVEWASSFGGISDDERLTSIAVTEDGGYIVGGYFHSSRMQVGDYTLTNNGGYDAYLVKYDRNNEVEWASSFGGNNSEYLTSIAATEDGGYIVGGYYKSTSMQVGDYTLTNKGNNDAFIVKYNRNNEVEWASSFDGTSNEYIQSIAETEDGDYIVGGYYNSSSMQVGDYTLTSNGGRDAFIVKYKPKEIPDIVYNRVEPVIATENIVRTQDGGYVIGGSFSGTNLTIGNYTLSSNGDADICLIKYNKYDEVDWATSFGGTDYEKLYTMAETQDGGFIVGGYFESPDLKVGDYTLQNWWREYQNEKDGFLVKLDKNGEVDWATSIGGYKTEQIYSVAGTKDGGCIALGLFGGEKAYVGKGLTDYYGSFILNGPEDDPANGLLLKFDKNGVIEWGTSFGEGAAMSAYSIAETEDGGYIVGGCFQGESIQIGDYSFTEGASSSDTPVLVKFNANGEIEYANAFECSARGSVTSVVATDDGGYIVGGYYDDSDDSSIKIGEYTLKSTNRNAYGASFFAKFNNNNEVEFATSIGNSSSDSITSIAIAEDGGYLVAGRLYSMNVGPYILNSRGDYDGFILKYDKKGKIEWATSFGGTNTDDINSIVGTDDGGCMAIGYTRSNSLIADDHTLNWNKPNSGVLLKISPFWGAKEQEEITFENQIKQFNITTDVKEIDGVKGGTIYGEDKSSYEKVKYGETSIKPIIMTPDENYEIIGITVNGKEYQYTTLPDGSYQMPQFENMTEDKHIVVTYSLKDNKITINKEDSNTGEKIPNVEFKLDQVDERTNPVTSEIIGDLTDNGIPYYTVGTNIEVTNSTLGQLINNGTYYFVEKDGTFVPTNSKTYRTDNSLGTTGVQNSVANSYMKIDLTSLQGVYYAVVNARVSSQSSYDYGFATITNNTTAPLYSNSEGRFMHISGTVANEIYNSIPLEGGNVYYLHLGYRKNNSRDLYEDQVVINNIKIYKANEERYNFIDNNGVYESSNAGKNGKVCNSYIPIDLTNYTGKYNIKVNAQISTQSGDYGYVTINKEQTAPSYNTKDGRFVYITGKQSAKNYTLEIDGGYQYYLHLGYYKDETSNTSGDDIFKVNSVNVTLSDSELFHTSVTTNSEGQAITQIPFGKYKITEVNAPKGYKGLEQPREIDFRGTDGAQHEFTIENEKLAKVIVHHYIKGTTTKLSDDEEYYGAIDEDYTTSPKLDIAGYALEKDVNDGYVLPTNATGQYRAEDTIVTYYYIPMPATVIVNHYIEGTETPVPLKNGSGAPKEIINGEPGENYTTSAITSENLDARYELVEVPENSSGIYTEEEITVNYFYKLKSYKITTEVEEYDQTNILGDTEHIRGGNILGEKENPYEIVKHSDNSVKDIIVTPEQGYEVQTLTINGNVQPFTAEPDGKVSLNKFINVTEDKHVVVRLGKKTSSVLVHHYIEGTTTKVPSKYGGEVEDQTTTGAIGNPYITNPTDELTDRYELVTMPSNASGLFTESPIEVIYYYREVPAKVIVNHYIVNTTDPVPLNNGGTASQEIINGYVTKPYTTEKLTNISDQYEYVSNSGNISGQMTKADIIVNYYYAPKAKAYAKVNYIAINSDNTETILETIDYEGNDGEEYTAHSKDFTGYELVQSPDVETKILDKNQVTIFNYYYRQNTGILEKHIDLYSGDILFNDTQDGNVGDQYEINSKTFDGYDIATNKKYYEKQIKDNPNILSDNGVDSIEGLLDKLNLEPNDPYIPDNYKGTMRESTIEIKYYYMKKAKVIVEYKDKLTDEPIHPDKPINGHEKDPYSTTPENIDGYDLTEDPEYTPTNTEGEMTPDTITVTYYYEQKAEVEVNHIYIVDETLIENGKIEGHVKDLYKTNSLDSEQYPNYRLVTNKEYYDYAVEKDSTILSDNNVTTVGELLAKLKLSEYDPYIPTNSKGEMTKDKIIVNYYYKKQAKVIVKHIDEETGKEIADPEEETKDIGDPYSAEPKTIEKYEVVKEKLPENAEGIVDEDGEEVIYYYRKVKKPIIPTANSGDTDEKQNKGEKVMSPQTGDITLIVAIGMLIVFAVLNILEKTNMNKKGTKPTSIIK